ncbi:MAG: hypothetical protein WAW36_02510 [Methylovulum miyakonense]|uniref:AbrB/MazE/SpoVT family DNA-binding domain-containing protein n=1 Tax=Methylovulum miyakonense TaxID=645578 RepID=UPI003BB55519
MTVLTVKTSADAHIISLPETIMAQVGWQKGALIDMSIENGHIVLAPKQTGLTLKTLLAGSPTERLGLLEEDTDWLSASAVGSENRS